MAKNCFIFGTGRSGTTVITASLARSGFFVGSNLTLPINIMPDGAYEDRDIQRWNDAMIDALDAGREPAWPDPRGMLSKMAQRPFALKDPRFSTTYRLWKPLAPSDHICLVTFRDPISFVKSARRLAGEVTEITESDDQLLKAWGYTYQSVLRQDDGYFRYIHYDTIMDESIFPYLEKWLDCRIVRGFVRKELVHPEPHPCPMQHAVLYTRLLERMARQVGIPPTTSSSEDCRSDN